MVWSTCIICELSWKADVYVKAIVKQCVSSVFKALFAVSPLVPDLHMVTCISLTGLIVPLGVASINCKKTELRMEYSTAKELLKSYLFTMHVMFAYER